MFFLLLALFLFPIAIYCTLLGMINRRAQPLAVSGAWDFLGVLLATSGFLLFVGPALLSGAFSRGLRELPIQRESGSIGSAITEIWAAWWVLWLLYYFFVLCGGAFLLWTRRNTTVIYNIDPPTLDSALARAAQWLGLEVERRGNCFYIGTGSALSGLVTTEGKVPPAQPVGPITMVDAEAFPLLSNVSLHWRSGKPETRIDLERELRKALSETITVENTVGGWLLGIGVFLFLFIIMMTGIALMLALSRTY